MARKNKKVTVKQWVKALRSGKYAQADGSLKVEDRYTGSSYCCLGVLADIKGANWHGGACEFSATDNHGENAQFFLANTILRKSSQTVLAKMNDKLDGFEAIADHIEKYYDADREL